MEPPSRAIPGEITAGITGALFLLEMIMTIQEIMIREKNLNFIKVKNQNMWRRSIEMILEYHKRILIRMILGVTQETGIISFTFYCSTSYFWKVKNLYQVYPLNIISDNW